MHLCLLALPHLYVHTSQEHRVRWLIVRSRRRTNLGQFRRCPRSQNMVLMVTSQGRIETGLSIFHLQVLLQAVLISNLLYYKALHLAVGSAGRHLAIPFSHL
jgi:hypothetical protein